MPSEVHATGLVTMGYGIKPWGGRSAASLVVAALVVARAIDILQ